MPPLTTKKYCINTKNGPQKIIAGQLSSDMGGGQSSSHNVNKRCYPIWQYLPHKSTPNNQQIDIIFNVDRQQKLAK